MYAVIFSANAKSLDEEYLVVANRMREIAKQKYGCIDFVAVTEGDREVAISYWPNTESIEAWKNDPEHKEAQRLGREKWYSEYKVQVVKVEREYQQQPKYTSTAHKW